MINVMNFMMSAMMIMGNGAVTPNPTMVDELNTVYTTMVDEIEENYWAAKAEREVERSFKFIYNEDEGEVWLNFSDGHTAICSSGKDLSKAIEAHTDYAAVCSIENEMIVLIKDNYAIGIDIDRRSYEKEAYE